jgi:hypothetical protein
MFQVMFVVMRHVTNLRKIYNFYSGLGYDASPDNTFIMIRMQYWRFLKDCKFHHYDMSLTEMDRLTSKKPMIDSLTHLKGVEPILSRGVRLLLAGHILSPLELLTGLFKGFLPS